MKQRHIVMGIVALILVIATGMLAFGPKGGVPLFGRVAATKASELPVPEADLIGVFTQRQDRSIFVATTIQEYSKQEFLDGSKKLTHIFSGPFVEIVTTRNTAVYEDVTNAHPAPHTQQFVEESTLEGLGPEALVTAWGTRQGDRLIADVLVYYNP